MDRCEGEVDLFKAPLLLGLEKWGIKSYDDFPSKGEIKFDLRKSVAA